MRTAKVKQKVSMIEKSLKSLGIRHEPIEYDVFLFGASAYTIYTNNCTIEVDRQFISINDIQVDTISELIEMILLNEGSRKDYECITAGG